MLDTLLKIVSIISTAINIIVKLAEMLKKRKERHQKSNRPRQS